MAFTIAKTYLRPIADGMTALIGVTDTGMEHVLSESFDAATLRIVKDLLDSTVINQPIDGIFV